MAQCPATSLLVWWCSPLTTPPLRSASSAPAATKQRVRRPSEPSEPLHRTMGREASRRPHEGQREVWTLQARCGDVPEPASSKSSSGRAEGLGLGRNDQFRVSSGRGQGTPTMHPAPSLIPLSCGAGSGADWTRDRQCCEPWCALGLVGAEDRHSRARCPWHSDARRGRGSLCPSTYSVKSAAVR